MTPSATLELAREVMATLSRRDVERLIALADPEVEWRSFFAIGEGGVYRGHDGTRRYLSDLSDAFTIGRADMFRQGKVVCFRAFRDPEHALEAVGLRR